jgi:hypothetical protein
MSLSWWIAEEGYRGSVRPLGGEREVKIYALSLESFKRLVEKGLRSTRLGGDAGFLYIGSKNRELFDISRCLTIYHKTTPVIQSFFKRYVISELHNEYCEIRNNGLLRRYFVVCDCDGKEARRCARFVVADFLLWMFGGQKLTDVEKQVIELLGVKAQDKAWFETENFFIDLEQLEVEIGWPQSAVRSVAGWVYKRETKAKSESGIFEEKRAPLFVFFMDFRSGAKCMYPRISSELMDQLVAELVVNA